MKSTSSLCLVSLALCLGVLVNLSKASSLNLNDLFNLNGRNHQQSQQQQAQSPSQSQHQQNSRSARLQDLAQPDDVGLTCGYAACPSTDPHKTNVHIIAHTHDDVGWLKTVDQYYYGTNVRAARANVQQILDSLIPQLVMDKSRRFIYVEMSFFTKWWDEQNESMRSIVRRLVDEGRLEFINGGWCMNDEATVTYQSTIEQMTLGLKFLNETFGSCAHPKVGWQIDPFGHSNEQASLFSQFGFDGMFFTRISYEDKKQRTDNRSLDIIWHGDEILDGQTGSIFTNIFRDGYDAPSGYCFDALCYDDNLVDNKKSYEYNIEQKGQGMIAFVRNYTKAKMTNQVLIPFGGDFQYYNAGQNFKSLDKLIKYIRANAPDINIFYSTPSCYQYAVHQVVTEKEIRLPEKYDDFMPYDSTPTVWWSGYFVSRPSVKLIERNTASLLQVARLISFSNLLNRPQARRWSDEAKDHEAKCLLPLWEILSDLQHHDAVTGTERQHVADDYVRRSTDASQMCVKFIGDFRRAKITEALKRSPDFDVLKFSGRRFKLDPVFLEDTMLCPALNISQCDAMESDIDFKRYLNRTMNQPSINNGNANGFNGNINSNANGNGNSSVNGGLDKGGQTLGEHFPNEFITKSVLINVYNPLAHPVINHDIRLPCNGVCDLNKIKVIQLSTNESMKLVRFPVPSGIASLPFRDAMTNYEFLFYADIPALGYTSFIIEDLNNDELVDEENEAPPDTRSLHDDQPESSSSAQSKANKPNHPIRTRRIKRDDEMLDLEERSTERMLDDIGEEGEKQQQQQKQAPRYEYFEMSADGLGFGAALASSGHLKSRANQRANSSSSSGRTRRESSLSQQDRIILKFDMSAGVIVGLKRVSDGTTLSITQKFGYYFPANTEAPPGAYIFRANSSEPITLDKPIVYKMYKRKNSADIEIHQKWASWLWQTIKVDPTKNYIEFDYVVGPIPTLTQPRNVGREVVTRYITNMANNGIFMTDSASRQLLTRHRIRSRKAEDVGGSFFPVASTIMLKGTGNTSSTTRANNCSAAAIAVSVDRAQAGTSLNEGQLELLIHRRHSRDDNFGVGEPLNEPGEDGRGLVTRGKHRLYIIFNNRADNTNKPQLFKLPDSPRKNLEYEKNFHNNRMDDKNKHQAHPGSTYVVQDQIYNDLNQESKKHLLKPTLTFDRLRVSAAEFLEMINTDSKLAKVKTDLSMLNTSLPYNIHLLTLQPWSARANELLIRLENLDNPLTVSPFPDHESYMNLIRSYRATSDYHEVDPTDICAEQLRPRVGVDIEYLIKRIRIVSLEELTLGANAKLKDDKRLNWTDRLYDNEACEPYVSSTYVRLAPRQIRTFLARFETI